MAEQWFAIYRISTGALVSTGVDVAPAAELVSKNFGKVPIAGPPLETEEWDAATLTMKARVIPAPFIVPALTGPQFAAVIKNLLESPAANWTLLNERQCQQAILRILFRDLQNGTGV